MRTQHWLALAHFQRRSFRQEESRPPPAHRQSLLEYIARSLLLLHYVKAALRSCLITWVPPPSELKVTAYQLAIGTGSFSLMRYSVLLKYNTSQPITLVVARWLGLQRGSTASKDRQLCRVIRSGWPYSNLQLGAKQRMIATPGSALVEKW